ncbi:MAG: thioredoxin family protein [Bacteroidales bacterium]|jgi:thioredoxin-related protein|nr:thioredoxin family protein [Bacteroidales bacterium]MBR4715855.1 thioredoxin family protein [Bacteroidales bacterium]
MKRIVLVLLLLAGIGAVSAQEKKYYNEEVDAMAQIQTASMLAKQSGRYVLCQVGGNWCPWCIRFANFATTDSVIAPLIERNFVYVHINYSKANKNPEAMKYLGNPARFGFPVFVILDEEGKPIHIQESASLEEGKSYDRKKVENFLSLWTKKAVTTLK